MYPDSLLLFFTNWHFCTYVYHCVQGHLAPISSADQVDQVMSKLLEDPKTASATHNIIGYRVLDESSGKVVQVISRLGCKLHFGALVTPLIVIMKTIIISYTP